MRESTIEDYLVSRVEEIGGEIRKVKWLGRSKAPDRLVLLPAYFSGNGILMPPQKAWVEVKRPGKKNTFPADAHERAQDREHTRLRQFGETVLVIDSYADVDRLVSRW